jgi:Tol biopolymer transport system component
MNRRFFLCSATAMALPITPSIAASLSTTNGGRLRPLTAQGHGDNRAVYTPDARRIVFASMRSGKSQLWEILPDGRGLDRFHRSDANDFGRAAFNASGSHVCFSSDRDGQNAIYVLDIASKDARRVSNLASWSFGPTWSTRNSIAYFSREGGNDLNIWTVSPDGSDRTQITDRAGESRQPWWSPDGMRIAYSANAGAGSFELWTCDAKGESTVRISNGGDWQQPFWSPDGRWIAASVKSSSAYYQIALIRPGENEVRLIPQPSQTDNVHPAWSPDGKHIVFTSGKGFESSLWQFSLL